MRYESENIFCSLLSNKNISFIQKSLRNKEVVSFCLWAEDQILSYLFPYLNIKKYISCIQSGEKLNLQKYTIKKYIHIGTKSLMDNLINLLNKNTSLLESLMEFLYNREVVEFYRKLSDILSPVIEIDFITIEKKIKKENLSKAIIEKLQIRARLEFAYWAERFVTSWYEDLSKMEDFSIKGVPFGPIAEYDLITALMLDYPEKCYWDQENYNVA
jgi:hypothetical protein